MVLPPELARIHALIAAEGTLHYEKKNHAYMIHFTCFERELCDLFSRDFVKIYGRKPYLRYARGRVAGLKVCSKRAFQQLSELGIRYESGLKVWEIPLAQLDKRSALYWIKAFFSGDGYLYWNPHKRDFEVTFFSCNLRGLKQLEILLRDFFNIENIRYNMSKPHGYQRLPIYMLRLRNKHDVLRFIRQIGSYRAKDNMKIREVIKFLSD